MIVTRPLALALAASAVGLVVALVAHGAVCGMEVERGVCGPAGCTPLPSECAPYVHPFLWGGLGASVFAGVLAWRGRPVAVLTLAVALGAAGALLGRSLGLWVPAVSVVLVAAGAALPARGGPARARLLAAAAALLAVAPMLLVMTLYALAPEPTFGKRIPPPVWAIGLAAGAPAAAWVLLLAYVRPWRR